ncbi:MAG: sporulation protein YlmC/YmxH family [Anaerosporomusa subterranea]|jgi:YlmC/YmxH family sporulation protein|nr:sporulation protein YlmC/YmxH family [Anaerosporomusa subterranea]
MTGKEVINIADGARLGIVEECDLGFDSRTGKIESLLLPGRGGLLQLFGECKGAVIPWQSIRRIGDEVIITDMSDSADRGLMAIRHDR